MKRLLSTLAVLAALLAVAIPAQATTDLGHRYHLGHKVSMAELNSFGCGDSLPVRSLLLQHDGHWVVAPKGTVRHPSRIVLACRFLHPHPAADSPVVQSSPDLVCDETAPDDPSRCIHMTPDSP